MKQLRILAVILILGLITAGCDEGDGGIRGIIEGSVSAEGAGIAGVAVSLSTGQTATTDASGAYSIPNLASGNYVVEISGFEAAGAQFSSTTRAAVVNQDGQRITVDFSGTFIRTSVLTGTVTVTEVGALDGVTVSVSGIDSQSTVTDAEGRYTIGGLRTGTHTLTVSDFDGNLYQFTSNPAEATVAIGATEVVNFEGTVIRTASVSGALFLDENLKNDLFEGPGAENLLEAAGITLTLQGPNVSDVQSVVTDSSGAFLFDSLVAGQYLVAIDTADGDVPSYARYGADTTGFAVSLGAGQDSATYFPFDIVLQTVELNAFTGLDSISPGHNPVPGATVTLYPTEQDATDATNALGSGATDGEGRVDLTFARADDLAPSSGTDNIVFAVRTADPATFVPNGEDRIEVIYDVRSPFSLAPDTFDYQNTTFTACVLGRTVMAIDTFGGGWLMDGFINDTLAPVDSFTVATDGTGRATITHASATGPLDLGDTIYMHWLPNDGSVGPPTNPGAPVPYTFRQFARPNNSVPGVAVGGSYLRYEWNGFNGIGGPGCIGIEEIQWDFADVTVRVHHEQDDTTGYTAGDDTDEVTDVAFTVAFANSGDTIFSLGADVGGAALFPGLPTDSAYQIHADTSSGGARQKVLDPTSVPVTLDGSTHSAEVCPLEGSNGCSTFAHKFVDNSVGGTVRSADGVDADGVRLKLFADPSTLQPDLGTDTVETTVASGIYVFSDLTEGSYTVMSMDSVDASGDSIWAFRPGVGTTTTNGPSGSGTLNFLATRMDTRILGLVVHDRNGNATLAGDPDEVLAGAEVMLYRGIGASQDSLHATTTSSSSGSYFFARLPEGTYTVTAAAASGQTETVLTDLASGTGEVVSAHTVTTAASTAALGDDNSRQVGDTTGLTMLPRWNYAGSDGLDLADTHFTVLANNTAVSGSILDGTTMAGVSGMTVELFRCEVSPATPSPPAGGVCTTYLISDAVASTTTDATGVFTFGTLREGVYEIRPDPSSAGSYTTATPPAVLTITEDPGDQETAAAILVN